jgi:hypothetical protein
VNGAACRAALLRSVDVDTFEPFAPLLWRSKFDRMSGRRVVDFGVANSVGFGYESEGPYTDKKLIAHTGSR